MYRPRIIPVLLLKNQGIVKSIKFKNHRYIGDPINAVKIFNDSNADELVFLDINATKERRLISLDFVKDVGEEANMPFSVGGGISNIDQVKRILSVGAEKVVIGSRATDLAFIEKACNTFGSSTITVCVDLKKNLFGNYQVMVDNATNKIKIDYLEYITNIVKAGAGEIIIQSVDKDGTLEGYDIELIKKIAESISIPLVALGGANGIESMKEAWFNGNASALAAGSMFVYHGIRRGILVNYPSPEVVRSIIEK